MGTLVEVIVVGSRRAALERAAERAFREVERIERKLSVYRPDSEIAEINRRAGVRPVRVDEELLGLIRQAGRYSEMTGGAFDITVFALGPLWDFDRPDFRVPAPTTVAGLLDRVDYRKVRWDEARSTVFLERAGMGISLGGIAKGYAVDRAVRILRDAGVQGGVVSAGGDLLAFGKREDGGPWRVGVRNPRERGRNIAVLAASDLAVATSGDYERFRIVGGNRYHHILDPRTGYPARGCMSATVVAGSAMEADALATAAFVLGPEKGKALLEGIPGVEGILVDREGKVVATKGLAQRVGGGAATAGKPDVSGPHQKQNESRIE